jgi:hypothetical protein
MKSIGTTADESFQRLLASTIGQGSERFWIRHYPFNTPSQSRWVLLSGYWWLVSCLAFAPWRPASEPSLMPTRKTPKPDGQGLTPLSQGKPLESPSSADTTIDPFGTYNRSCVIAFAAKNSRRASARGQVPPKEPPCVNGSRNTSQAPTWQFVSIPNITTSPSRMQATCQSPDLKRRMI